MGILDEEGITELTEAHQKVSRRLERLGYSIMEEVPFPPYTIDIYIPDYHLGVEVDGPHHQEKKDRKRDNFLMETYELPIIRFNLKEKPSHLKKLMVEAVETWEDSALARFDRVKDKTPWL